MNEQSYDSIQAFLQHQKQKRSHDNAIREQLDRAISQKVYEQEERLDRQGFWLFILSMVCICQFIYVLTM